MNLLCWASSCSEPGYLFIERMTAFVLQWLWRLLISPVCVICFGDVTVFCHLYINAYCCFVGHLCLTELNVTLFSGSF